MGILKSDVRFTRLTIGILLLCFCGVASQIALTAMQDLDCNVPTEDLAEEVQLIHDNVGFEHQQHRLEPMLPGAKFDISLHFRFTSLIPLRPTFL